MPQLWAQATTRKGGENLTEAELKTLIDQSKLLNNYNSTLQSPPNYPLDSPEAIERYTKDLESIQENNYRGAVLKCTFDIVLMTTRYTGSLHSNRKLSPNIHKNAFGQLQFHQLLSLLSSLNDDVERINEAKPILSELIGDDAKAEWDRSFTVTIRTISGYKGTAVKNWEEHENQIRAKLAVLDMALLIYGKLITTYEEEIADRKKSPRTSQILKNMAGMVKKANKIKPAMTKANAKAQKTLIHGVPDLKTCSEYIDASAKFSELYSQYINLQTELSNYTNEIADIPLFPALSDAETSAARAINETWRRYS